MTHQKIQKHIEIARSSVSALSSMGRKSGDALFSFLATRYETVGLTIVDDETDLQTLAAKQPDLVFVGMKYVLGASGTKIWLSDYLERRGITHTGSAEMAISLEQNKVLAKARVQSAGITTSPYLIVADGTPLAATDLDAALQFPLFVKPTDLGAGKGIDDNSVVHTIAELNAKTKFIHETYATEALVERFLAGREFSVAVLKSKDSGDLMAMPLELLPAPNIHGHRVLSKAIKSAELETPVFPVTEPALRATLIDLAQNAFVALGARDFGRIDIRLDADGMPHFLEANLIPCLIRGSGNFPKACLMNIDMDYDEMILHIIDLAFARAATTDPQETPVHSGLSILQPLLPITL